MTTDDLELILVRIFG